MEQDRFRRLCFDELDGRLQGAERAEWDSARKSDPELATFHAQLASQYHRASQRLSKRAVAAEIPAPSAKSGRARWFAPVLALAALAAGAFSAHSWLQYLRRNDRTPAPSHAPTANTQPANNVQGNTGEVSPRDNTPIADTDTGTEPAANTPSSPATNDPPQVTPAPGPAAPAPGPALFTVGDSPGAQARIRAAGVAEYVAAQPQAGLGPGDRFKMDRGDGLLRSNACALVLGGRGEIEFVQANALKLLRGRLALRVIGDSFNVEHDGAMVALAPGEYLVVSIRGVCDINVLTGRAEVARGDERASAGRGELISLARGLPRLPLAAEHAKAMRAETDVAIVTLLHWDFEEATPPCDLGAARDGGLDGGKCLHWDNTQQAAGSSGKEPPFVATLGLRLRAWILTDAKTVEASLRLHTPEGTRVAAIRLPVPPGEGWRMVDVPLDGLRTGPLRDQPGLIEGASYNGVQFCVPPQAGEPLARHDLAIDDVRLYRLR